MPAKKTQQPTPLWLYRFLNWMKTTPLNGVLVALSIFMITAGLSHWVCWQYGNLESYTFDAQLLFPATWLPANLLFWLWLDSLAKGAINNFVRGIGKSSQEANRVYVDFISIREPIALVLVLIGLAGGFGDSLTRAETFGVTQFLLVLLMGIGPIIGGVFELFSLYRLLRQLFLVNALYKGVKKINLFNLYPIYALSRYGYQIALLFILATVLIDAVFTLMGLESISLAYNLYTMAISLIVFLAPLLGINGRLRSEKEKELQQLGIQLDGIHQKTEAAVRTGKLIKLTELRTAASALKEQMDTVRNVATWPWNPGSLRNLLLPVLLPLFLAVLQRYLLSFLGL